MFTECKDRIEARTPAVVHARVRDSVSEREACIIDVSTRGLLATAAQPPRCGDFIDLTFGRNVITGQVKWAGPRRFGVSLRERVSVTAMVEGGSGCVELQGTAVTQSGSGGVLEGLRLNPELGGHAMQFAFMVLVAVSGAYTISHVAAGGLDDLNLVIETAMHQD